MQSDKRKMIKWQPFQALPEYQQEINKTIKALQNETMPILSEDKMEEINQILIEAINKQLQVKITYFYNNKRHIIQGTIKKIENNKVYFIENYQSVSLKNIIDIVK